MNDPEGDALLTIEAASQKLIADIFGVLFYAMISENNVVALDHFKMGMRLLIKAKEDARLALIELRKEGVFDVKPSS